MPALTPGGYPYHTPADNPRIYPQTSEDLARTIDQRPSTMVRSGGNVNSPAQTTWTPLPLNSTSFTRGTGLIADSTTIQAEAAGLVRVEVWATVAWSGDAVALHTTALVFAAVNDRFVGAFWWATSGRMALTVQRNSVAIGDAGRTFLWPGSIAVTSVQAPTLAVTMFDK